MKYPSIFRRQGKGCVLPYGAAVVVALSGLVITSQLHGNDRAVTVEVGSTESEIEEALRLCGKYEQGCERAWYEDEVVRTRELLPYKLDTVEVSIANFASYVERYDVKTEAEIRLETVVTDPDDPLSGYYADDKFWFNAYSSADRALPVVHVTLKDAANYCASLGKRLPTEAEWEHAARGPERERFPWGNDWDDFINYRGAEFPHKSPMPVGSYQATSRGYHDLSGSVSEWTSTEDGDSVIVKGGFRYSRNVANLRAAVRRLEDPAYSGDDVGFRCAETLEQWPDAGATVIAESDSREADSLRIASLLASAKKMIEADQFDLALADLDRADAIDTERANTRSLRSEIQNRRSAEQIDVVEQQNSQPVVAEELLNRVRAMRKERETKQVLFNEYLNNDVSDAIVRLFESSQQ